MESSSGDHDTADRADGSASSRENPLIGRVLADRYEVVEVASVGANTVICDAIDQEGLRPVTLKIVRPEHAADDDFRYKFHHLAEIANALTHPNVAAVLDWGEVAIDDDETVYWTVEALGGGSLRDLLDRGRLIEPSQALLVGLEACRALDAAHQKGLFHTELTPSKLVFGVDRRLRVVDFGMARLLAEKAWRDPSSVPTHVARYASPEQATGSPIDARADVYALSLVLIESVTGSVPFDGDSTTSTLAGRVDRLMPVSADLGALASVLERAGRPEPADRYSAAEFGRALVDAAQRLPKPEPIPILASQRFDTTEMRRPSDPTGGIARPGADEGAHAVTVPDDDQAGANLVDDDLPATEELTAAAATAAAVAAVDPALRESDERDRDDDLRIGIDEETDTAGSIDAEAAYLRAVDAVDVTDDRANVEATDADADVVVDADSDAAAPAESDAAAPADATGPHGTMSMPTTVSDEVAASAPTAVVDEIAAASSGTRPELFDDDLGADPSGEVFDGRPAGRRRGSIVALVLVFLVGLGALAYAGSYLLRTKSYEVPVLAGTNLDEARNLVAGNDWEIEIERERSDDFPEPDDVIRTVPGPGVDLEEGDLLVVVVSDGFEFRELPESTGLPVEEAIAQIEAIQLGAQEAPERVFSETVEPGVVESWQVAGDSSMTAGARILPGETIVLTVSMGPEPRTVPELVGRPAADVVAELEGLRLVAGRGEDVFSDDVPAGSVVSQSPAPGERLARGGTVSFTVSKGPDIVTFPEVIELPYAEAVDRLTTAGFAVGDVLGTTEGRVQQATIDGEPVEPGAEFRRGQPIDLVAL